VSRKEIYIYLFLEKFERTTNSDKISFIPSDENKKMLNTTSKTWSEKMHRKEMNSAFNYMKDISGILNNYIMQESNYTVQ